MMEKGSKIYIAGHKGLVGSAITRQLKKEGYNNLVFKTHAELELTDQQKVFDFFKEERPVQAYGELKEALEYGFEGLCFTKLEPQKVRTEYGVAKASLVWLTFTETKTATTVNPKDLARLSSIISTEIANNPSKDVVLLDCLDQIIFANSFEKAKGLLKELRELCQENDATLLLSIDPEMFENEQLAAMENELKEVGG